MRRFSQVGAEQIRQSDAGAVTVWAAWAVAGLALVFGLLLALGAAASARHRANSAADLSALAAAAYGPWGQEYACGQAKWVTERMAMRLGECRMSGWVAYVEVVATVNGLGPITARAAAGPVNNMSRAEEIPAPIAGNGRPRAVSGITTRSRRVCERYRRPADVRPERRGGFTRRSLPTSCRQTVTTGGGCAV